MHYKILNYLTKLSIFLVDNNNIENSRGKGIRGRGRGRGGWCHEMDMMQGPFPPDGFFGPGRGQGPMRGRGRGFMGPRPALMGPNRLCIE